MHQARPAAGLDSAGLEQRTHPACGCNDRQALPAVINKLAFMQFYRSVRVVGLRHEVNFVSQWTPMIGTDMYTAHGPYRPGLNILQAQSWGVGSRSLNQP